MVDTQGSIDDVDVTAKVSGNGRQCRKPFAYGGNAIDSSDRLQKPHGTRTDHCDFRGYKYPAGMNVPGVFGLNCRED